MHSVDRGAVARGTYACPRHGIPIVILLSPCGMRPIAIAALATCVGGLMLARAVKDRTFSDHILVACRAEVLRELDGGGR
jgi:hypothetical protein